MLRGTALIAVVACLLVAPATASAGKNLEATFQDDKELIYTTPGHRAAVLDQLRDLGVDRIRATILWRAIAPSPDATTDPGVDMTDPESYGAAWAPYDDLVRGAAARGIKLNFNVSGPSPLWANRPAPRPDVAESFEPGPQAFGAFVRAVGRRYAGDYVDADGQAIPRVDYWSIWNEPNHATWLTPTWAQTDGGAYFPRSAALYRALADQAYAALRDTTHGRDRILVGETAPAGNAKRGVRQFMLPLAFVRGLYCVNRKLEPLTGARAERMDCPADPARMTEEHPVLFEATGFAHHPYTGLKPDVPARTYDSVTIGALDRLTETLDTTFRAYGKRRRMPLFLTEFGYQTNPPDTFGVSLRNQAKFINQSEFIAFKNKRVRTLGQFLLVDDTRADSANFQTGLVLRAGRRPKPSLDAYRLPLWLEGKGTRPELFAVLRPAPNGSPATAELQFRARGGGEWRTLRTLRSQGRFNYVNRRVRFPGPGAARIAYGDHRSRVARVRSRP